ncbi:hypothetical protein LOTGIDRAFT_166819 [Lottia gigantea]|uniref:Uncharacterized protein n=1 Tax=Lottia gigantea TaxID=225164 RepID=V4A0M2_LOTGI|nr:hypothetical protein LOTGIDRAFT_166819 [Lottia gigantea]ESO86816.1 hypothetical protein LOTGIDRAFT_166819 [Lottia gigantea]
MPDYRANKPQPNTCTFLCHDVRLLNEPICTVTTKKTLTDQPFWWHNERESDYFDLPSYSNDTSYRKDFQYRKDRWPPASTRHASNPNTDWAYGIVPVNQLGGRKHKHRLFTEKMSYEHQYSSRNNPNYPNRGQRQGHFVWNEMKGDKLQNFIDFHQSLNEMQDNEKGQKKSSIKPTTNSIHFNDVPETLPAVMRETEQVCQSKLPAGQLENNVGHPNGASDYPNTVEYQNGVSEYTNRASGNTSMPLEYPQNPSDNSNNNAPIYYQPNEEIEWKLPQKNPHGVSEFTKGALGNPSMPLEYTQNPSDDSNNTAPIYYQPNEEIEWQLPRSFSK